MSAIANSNQPEGKPKTSRVKSYWHNIHWRKFFSLTMAIALCFYLTACGNSKIDSKAVAKKLETTNIIEVSSPTEIQRLSSLLDRYEPQVSIVSPKAEEVLNDTKVAVKFDIKNLPIFKNADFGLGPHIHVTLDNQEYKALYDLSQPATFENLSVGTHTIRAFASRPWHESFKNQGAYAQVTFNVLTKTNENSPEAKTPLLTYSRPVGTYGAEPILLDFYLQNAPLHLLAKEDNAINDWQIRATVNGQSFTFDRWEPIYLQGFKQGKNWVKLELIEEDGDAIANVFNSSAHLINFQPNGTDTLARLVRGEKIANIEAIVNPDYVPPAPVDSVDPATTTNPDLKVIATPKTLVPSPTTESKEEAKNTEKAAPTSIIPIPVAPIKSVPKEIVPVKPSKLTKPKEPVDLKTAPIVKPIVKPFKAIAPKAEPSPNTVLKKEPEAIAPKPLREYLKNYGSSSRKAAPIKPNVIKPIEKSEVKANNLEENSKETANTPKPIDSLPELIDLSTTPPTPIKVLTHTSVK